MRKKYKYKKTKELIKKLKPLWERYLEIEAYHWKEINLLEQEMQNVTDINDLEIFFCDNECVGIGNAERTMELIKREELEDD